MIALQMDVLICLQKANNLLGSLLAIYWVVWLHKKYIFVHLSRSSIATSNYHVQFP